MSYFSKHKRGFIGTIIFHGIVLILLLLFGFFTPLPLPGEEGILVNFGNSEQGSGRREPAPSKEVTPPVVREEKKQVTTPPPSNPPKQVIPPAKTEAKEEVMTQDYEKTVAIEAAKKKKEEERKKQQEELARKKKQEEIERQRQQKLEAERQQELERKRAEELERQRLAAEEAERQRKAEEERKRIEAEQQKIAEINSRVSNAFGSGGAGTSDSKSTGEGVTFPGGNQGSPSGSANSSNYGDGGGQGNGISFSLAGREAQLLAEPNYPGNEEGIVVVKVTVDKYGKVTNAEPGAKGSTTYNSQLLNAAKQAALKTQFKSDGSAPAFQQGTITYRFVLD